MIGRTIIAAVSVVMLGLSLIALKIVTGRISENGHPVPWQMWAFGIWTHFLLSYIVIREIIDNPKAKIDKQEAK